MSGPEHAHRGKQSGDRRAPEAAAPELDPEAPHPLLQLQAQAGNRATSEVIRRYVDPADPVTYTEPEEDVEVTPGYVTDEDIQNGPGQVTYEDVQDGPEEDVQVTAGYVTYEDLRDAPEEVNYEDDDTSEDSVYGVYRAGGPALDDALGALEPDASTTKYATSLPMDSGKKGEQISSADFALALYASAKRAAPVIALRQARAELQAKHPDAEPKFIETMAARRAASADLRAFADAWFTVTYGWTQEEIDRHIHAGEPVAVTYLDEEARKEYALQGRGSSLTIGMSDRPADTSQMWSKHSGKGWGIFVMDGSGEIYAEAHKMGMFHHSSFMAGGDVAAAGEIRIRNGAITGITNKSGHYTPTPKQLLSFFRELRGRGVDLTSVEFKDHEGNAVPGGAQAYLSKHDWEHDGDEDDDDESESDADPDVAAGPLTIDYVY